MDIITPILKLLGKYWQALALVGVVLFGVGYVQNLRHNIAEQKVEIAVLTNELENVNRLRQIQELEWQARLDLAEIESVRVETVYRDRVREVEVSVIPESCSAADNWAVENHNEAVQFWNREYDAY